MFNKRKYCIFFLLVTFFGISIYCYGMSAPFKKWDNSIFKKELYRPTGNLNKFGQQSEAGEFLINTPGCYIPNYMKHFKYNYTLTKNVKNACGVRAIFVDKLDNNRIKFRIDKKDIKIYSKNKKYNCCYKFAYKSLTFVSHRENRTQLLFKTCSPFQNGTVAVLDHEIIVVTCQTSKKKKEIYNDAYIILKKLSLYDSVHKKNRPWNTLLLGLDGMSKARLFDTMPKTSKYLRKNMWLDFNGYQKVESGTYSNLLSLLTGKNAFSIRENCETYSYSCEDNFIWKKYSAAGYKTAYGEDYPGLPDTYSSFQGYKKQTTDHYIRPFYRLGEKRQGSIMCTRMKPSATHLLNYALSFVDTYKYNNFFGVFWINSFSHGTTDNPTLLDKEMANWFKRLNATGVLDNTFVIFFSDHGTRFGDVKRSIGSYYDERLPMLFMWVPKEFRLKNSQKYTNMVLNQHRLITPYDLYMTLGDIVSRNKSKDSTQSEACLRCSSLFKLISLQRTCKDAAVGDTWCSCRKMVSVENSSSVTSHSLDIAVAYISNITNSISTIPCMICKPLTLQSVIRSHAFRNNDNMYNVVAFTLSHLVSFEATVVYVGEESWILNIQSISGYNRKGNCVINPNDRPYCECDVTECANKNVVKGANSPKRAQRVSSNY